MLSLKAKRNQDFRTRTYDQCVLPLRNPTDKKTLTAFDAQKGTWHIHVLKMIAGQRLEISSMKPLGFIDDISSRWAKTIITGVLYVRARARACAHARMRACAHARMRACARARANIQNTRYDRFGPAAWNIIDEAQRLHRWNFKPLARDHFQNMYVPCSLLCIKSCKGFFVGGIP